MTHDVSFGLAAAFATGNTIEAILAVWLLKRFLPRVAFGGAKDAFIFPLAAVVSSMPAATVRAVTMLLAGRISVSELVANSSTWLLGDLAGIMIIVPPLLALAGKHWTRLGTARLFELLLLPSRHREMHRQHRKTLR